MIDFNDAKVKLDSFSYTTKKRGTGIIFRAPEVMADEDDTNTMSLWRKNNKLKQ